jgi:hypothetical protein
MSSDLGFSLIFFTKNSDSVIFAYILFVFITSSIVIVCIKNICNYVLDLRHLKYYAEVLYHVIEWGKGRGEIFYF